MNMDELKFRQLCSDLVNINYNNLKTYELISLSSSVNIVKRLLDKELEKRETWIKEIIK